METKGGIRVRISPFLLSFIEIASEILEEKPKKH
jgi:hypothetical protein